MYDGVHARTYFKIGAEALHLVQQSALAAGLGTPTRMLDLPCGHGRALRWFRAAWPSADLVACDLDRDAVDWCVATLGATGIYSRPNLREVDLSPPFDVIWVGSLLTHFDATRWQSTLSVLAGALRPSGVLVFSAHGHQARENLRTHHYGLETSQAEALVDGWDATGFGYAAYPWDEGYGVSLSKPSWVRSILAEVPGLEEMALWLAGWDRHHDVFAVQKR